jgi:S-adenosylmethionine decarboxylase
VGLSNPTHLILNLGGCDKEKLASKMIVRKFLNGMPATIGMTLIKKASILEYDNGNGIDHGLTGTSILAESHLSFHGFTQRGTALIDIFSCTTFDTEKATAIAIQTFGATKVFKKVIERGIYFDEYDVEAGVEIYDNSER